MYILRWMTIYSLDTFISWYTVRYMFTEDPMWMLYLEPAFNFTFIWVLAAVISISILSYLILSLEFNWYLPTQESFHLLFVYAVQYTDGVVHNHSSSGRLYNKQDIVCVTSIHRRSDSLQGFTADAQTKWYKDNRTSRTVQKDNMQYTLW